MRLTNAKTPTIRKVNVKALVRQLDGEPEQPYPVYRMGGTYKYERPEVPGQTYRRYRNFP